MGFLVVGQRLLRIMFSPAAADLQILGVVVWPRSLEKRLALKVSCRIWMARSVPICDISKLNGDAPELGAANGLMDKGLLFAVGGFLVC